MPGNTGCWWDRWQNGLAQTFVCAKHQSGVGKFPFSDNPTYRELEVANGQQALAFGQTLSDRFSSSAAVSDEALADVREFFLEFSEHAAVIPLDYILRDSVLGGRESKQHYALSPSRNHVESVAHRQAGLDEHGGQDG